MANQAIMWGILFLLIALAIAAAVLWRKNRYETDYYNLFIIGITWLAVGLPLKNKVMWVLGLVFMVLGIANKNKWKKNRRTWNEINKAEKKTRIIIMVILGILVLAGFILLIIKI